MSTITTRDGVESFCKDWGSKNAQGMAGSAKAHYGGRHRSWGSSVPGDWWKARARSGTPRRRGE